MRILIIFPNGPLEKWPFWRKMRNMAKIAIWRKIAKSLTKILITCPTGPMKSVDFDENGENGENSDLIKNCQRLNKNSNWMFKGTSWKSGDFDENGDVTKFRQRFNENSNYISEWAAWKVAILTKNEKHGKNSDLTKNRQKFNENSNYMSNGAPWKVSIWGKRRK